MTILKSEIYTNNFFPTKIFQPDQFKKSILVYCKLFDKFILKVEWRPKKLYSGNSKRIFYVNVKIFFGLYLAFAINFMFELKMLFKKKFDMAPDLIWLSCCIPMFL